MKQKIYLAFLLAITTLIQTSEHNNLSLDTIPGDPLFSCCNFKEMLILSRTSSFWNKQVTNSVLFFEKFFEYHNNKMASLKDVNTYPFQYYSVANPLFTIINRRNMLHQEITQSKTKESSPSFCFTLSLSNQRQMLLLIEKENNPHIGYLDTKMAKIAKESHLIWNQSFDEFKQTMEEKHNHKVKKEIIATNSIHFKNVSFDLSIISWLLKSPIFLSKLSVLYGSSGKNALSCITRLIKSANWKYNLEFFQENTINLKKILKNNTTLTKKLYKKIHVFYWYNNFEDMELLLQNGANPNIASKSNYSFLFIIQEKNEPRFLKLFFEHGLSIQKAIESILFKRAINAGQPEIVSILLEYSKNKQRLIRHMQNKQLPVTFNALRSYKSTELLEILFRHGFDPNIQDENGIYLLKRAIQTKNKDNIQLILEHGADVDAILKKKVFFICFSDSEAKTIKMILENFTDNVQLETYKEREYILSSK